MPRRTSTSRIPLDLLAEMVCRHPVFLVGLSLLLTAASLLVTWSSLELKTGRNDLLSPDLAYNRRYLEFIREFSSLEGGVIVVEAADPGEAIAYAEELAVDLGPRLGEESRLFYKVDDEPFLRKAVLLLPEEDLRKAADAVERGSDLLGEAMTSRGLERLFRGIGEIVEGARGEEDLPREALPILEGFVLRLLSAVRGDGEVGPLLTGLTGEEARYNWSDDGRFLFVLIDPYREDDSDLTHRVRDSMGRIGPRHPGVAAGLTGRPVLAQDEMATVSRDMILASIASVLGVGLLFALFFRSLLQPFLGMTTLLVGITWSFGAATLMVGHLNLLSVVFGAILVGLGVDFGIHLLARYQEDRSQGSTPRQALRLAMQQTGGGIVTGGLTMASAFLAIVFGTFRGIGEMGIISGTGILLCLVSMLVLFPSLLVLADRRPPGRLRPTWSAPRLLVEVYRHPLPLLILSILLTGGAAWLLRGTSFEYNLLDLQVQELESVRYEKKLISGRGVTTWFCASLCESLPQARERAARFETLPAVRKVDGLPRLLPEDPEARLHQVERIREAIRAEAFGAHGEPEVETEGLLAAVRDLVDALEGAEEGAFQAGIADGLEAIGGLREDVEALQEGIRSAPGGKERLAAIQVAFQGELTSLLQSVLEHLPTSPLRLEEIPGVVRERFLGGEGHYLLMVYPKEDIWDRGPQEVFLQEVRTVDPDVTGAPVQVYESTGIMTEGYVKAGLVALVVVFVVILIDFGSLRSTILAMVPLLMGALWMAGGMRPLGLEFNSANLVVLPLILGIGVVNGVHVVHRYRESPRALVDILWSSTGKAVLLTSLTTIAGCGAIGLFSHHPGLSSLGYVLSLGVAACLLSAWLALPPLMQCFFRTARRKSRRRQ